MWFRQRLCYATREPGIAPMYLFLLSLRTLSKVNELNLDFGKSPTISLADAI